MNSRPILLTLAITIFFPFNSFNLYSDNTYTVSCSVVDMFELRVNEAFLDEVVNLQGEVNNTSMVGGGPFSVSNVKVTIRPSVDYLIFDGGTSEVGEWTQIGVDWVLNIGNIDAFQTVAFGYSFHSPQIGDFSLDWDYTQNEFNPCMGPPFTEGSIPFSIVELPTTDIKIEKIQSSDSVNVCSGSSSPFSYTLTAINCGNVSAVNVFITDTFPSQFEIDQGMIPSGCFYDPPSHSIKCEPSILDPGDTVMYEIPGMIASDEDAIIKNRAWITSDTDDPDLLNNHSEVTTVLEQKNSLITVEFACFQPDTLCENEEMTMTAILTNSGDVPIPFGTFLVSGVNLHNENIFTSLGSAIPSGNSFVVGFTESNTPDETLHPGGSFSIEITGNIGLSGAHMSISGIYGLCNDEISVLGCERLAKPCADLMISKTATPDTVCQFDQTTYSVKIKNNGPSTANNVRLVDLLDQGFKIDSTSLSDMCQAVGSALGLVECSFGDLASGDSVIIHYSGQVTGWGPITNIATCHTNTYDPNTENNQIAYNIYSENLRELVKQKVIMYLQDTYGEELKEVTQVYLCTDPLTDDVTISSFDPTQFTGILEQGDHFGWIDWDTDLRFEHPASYLFVSPKGDTVRIEDGMSWWPTMTFFDTLNSFNPFDEKYIVIAADTFKRELIETLKEDDPPEGVDSVCAFIVEGHDERASMRNGFHEDGERFKDELTKEKLGPGVKPENIKTIVGSSVEDLKKQIEEQKGKCKKFYFYYSGHGNQIGIYPNSNGFDALTYQDLYASLEKIGAEHYCILIDACHSGTAETALKSNEYFKDAQVDLYYSSASGKTSTGVNAGEGFYCETYGLFSYNLFTCWGDSEANEDGANGVDLCEAWKWFAKQDPEFLGGKYFDRFMPGKLEKAKGQMFEVEQSQEYLQLDLNMNYGNLCIEDNGLNYNVHLEYVIEEVSPSDLEDRVFAVSKWRRWTIEPSEPSNCDSINARLSFYIDPYFDIPQGTKGVLGPVTRSGPGEKWAPHYPFLHNLFDETINAYKISHFSQWAIGLVEENSTPVIEINEENQVSVYPNPISQIGSIEFKNQKEGTYQIYLIDSQGKFIKEIWDGPTPSGSFKIKFDLSELPPSNYWIKIQGSLYKVIPISKVN